MTKDKSYWLQALEYEFSVQDQYISRLEYLANDIFQFCTDDGELDEYFAEWAVKACYAINRREFPKYVDGSETYRWMIAMYNMPFFVDRTSFGVSIRTLFWSPNNPEIEYKMNFSGTGKLHGGSVSREEWMAFIDAVIAFSGVELSGL